MHADTSQDPTDVRGASTPEEAAALWWSAQYTSPSHFESHGSLGLAATAMSAQLLIGSSAKPGSIEIFKQLLEENLRELIPSRVTLQVDYEPREILLEVARAAGLRTNRFDWPEKTVMWLFPEKVEVRVGDRSDVQVIWEKQH